MQDSKIFNQYRYESGQSEICILCKNFKHYFFSKLISFSSDLSWKHELLK